MIVDQFNTRLTGGAASAALRLHRALLQRDVTSRFWHADGSASVGGEAACQPVAWPDPSTAPWGLVPAAVAHVTRRLILKWEKHQFLKGRPPESELFSRPRLRRDTRCGAIGSQAEIVHLHWIAGMIDYPSFFASVPDDLPIVWTLHDMNPLTGGCHYCEGCQRYATCCGHCPMLAIQAVDDLSNRSFRLKRDALRDKNLHVVTPSRWLATEARRSAVLADAKSIQVIPNGLDTATFAPMDKAAAKRQLGLRPDRLVIGFGAESLAARRKGFPELLSALSQLETASPITGLAFGNAAPQQLGNPLIELESAGYVEDEQRLATIYSAADLFVLPSLEDNLPQTGIEAMACGTPVVGFAIGGVPDFVRPHETGLLARKGDAADLARQITWLLDQPEACRRMGRQAREAVLREYTAHLQAERYIHLYSSLMEEHARQRDSRIAA